MQVIRKYLQPLCPTLLFLFLMSALLPVPSKGEAHEQPITAIYVHNKLSLTIPYHAVHAGAGKLIVEILDPEDHVLGRAEKNTNAAEGDSLWKQEVATTQPLPLEDLVWDRLRYQFLYNGETTTAFEQIRSISEILLRPVVHILGQTSYLAGGQAAIRVIVSDSRNHEIAGNSSIRVELLAQDHSPNVLFSGRLNHRGTTEAQFRFPAGLTGNYQLHYIAVTPIGSAEYTQPVRLEDKVSILLTTEKRIYQPGQTIHIRALALDRADNHASASSRLTFEIEDSRGNKVFKKATLTDAFGIASAEFALADEVNLGTYHLRARMGDPEAPTNTEELAFNVERYVLPKFKVAIELTAKEGKPKRDYRPGEHVTGTVHANYFFGEPVDNAEITIKASSMDVSLAEGASTRGRTNKDGTYQFDLKLPSYLTGRPLNKDVAPVVIEATVKDSSGHSEVRGESVTVSKSRLLITAIPESGKLIPGLENQVFVLTSYADGTPAMTTLGVHFTGAPEQRVQTDKNGVAVVRITPDRGTESLRIDAHDGDGNHVSGTIQMQSRYESDQILLRADRAVYKAGDRMEFRIFSTQQRGSVYIDIVKNKQTILTQDVDVVNGHADLVVRATPEMSGTLDINVYRFGQDAQAIGDHRLVFVQPAEELKIETIADAPVYKPGAEAHIHFHVTNERGEGVSAALGLQVVDEAVFALAEQRPGFAKVFFYLEQELMKPRYEIHSLSAMDVVESVSESSVEEHDRDIRALFSATEIVNPNRLDTEFGRTLPQERAGEYTWRYRQAFYGQVVKVADAISEVYSNNPSNKDLPKLFAAMLSKEGSKLHDAWGTSLRLEPITWPHGSARYYTVRSAGIDRQFDTPDDLTVTVEAYPQNAVATTDHTEIGVRIDHDRGPFNGLAEISGSVSDQTGAVIPGAMITLLPIGNGRHRHAVTDASGLFVLTALPPDHYLIKISALGFVEASRKLDLQPRDHAVLSSILNVGSVSQTVMVAAPPPAIETMSANASFAVGDGAMAPPPAASAGGFGIGRGRARAKAASSVQEAHVRSYFPEALYINPEILTDGKGNASITIPIADSITTWRMAMLASTKSGALGSDTSSLKVFQDFFVDLDLPITLTQGDRVSIPVAVYNYAGERGDVTLSLQPDDWFSMVDEPMQKTVTVDPGHVGASQFTLQTKHIGKFKLTLSAHMTGKADRRDIVVREIEVVPNGREQNFVFNGRLDASAQQAAQHTVQFPEQSIPDASKIFVRLYPGPLSQVIEGMDSILTMPGGCFEQTSSSTYPNVLALDYMKRTKKLTPEVRAKAEGYIANGYQRLLTFEVPGGGFSWFGNPPANKILTAYGLMEFNDMSKVYDVDPKLIERTRDWLISQQQLDGSWKPDTYFINEGATNRYNSDLLRITGYIAWALEKTGYDGPVVEKAKAFLESHLSGKSDPYTLAVLANFAVEYNKDQAFTKQILQMLLDARKEEGEQVYWDAEETSVYATGSSAAIETTGLAVQALLKWHQTPETVRKALTYIASKKEASGAWGTTQATIMALKALLIASEEGSADARGTAQVMLNGKVVEELVLTPENNDLFHQFAISGVSSQKTNDIQIRFEGTGGLAYQVVGRYFLPWDPKAADEPLSIDVVYDRTKLAQNDIVTATASIRNNLPKNANMVMVDLGIPPGFELLSEDLQTFEEKTANAKNGRLEKFNLTATQAILYFNAIAPKSTMQLRFRLRAKYPIRAKTFQSKIYEYYDPDVNSIARPVQLEVDEREHKNRKGEE